MKTRQAQGARLTDALRPINRSAVPKSHYNPEHEYDASPASRPYVLWFETLPSGDTAKVYLCPHPTRCDVVAHWNGKVRQEETCGTVAEAELLALEWWRELRNLMDVGPHDRADGSLPWV
jgi:hypothetical protein